MSEQEYVDFTMVLTRKVPRELAETFADYEGILRDEFATHGTRWNVALVSRRADSGVSDAEMGRVLGLRSIGSSFVSMPVGGVSS